MLAVEPKVAQAEIRILRKELLALLWRKHRQVHLLQDRLEVAVKEGILSPARYPASPVPRRCEHMNSGVILLFGGGDARVSPLLRCKEAPERRNQFQVIFVTNKIKNML